MCGIASADVDTDRRSFVVGGRHVGSGHCDGLRLPIVTTGGTVPFMRIDHPDLPTRAAYRRVEAIWIVANDRIRFGSGNTPFQCVALSPIGSVSIACDIAILPETSPKSSESVPICGAILPERVDDFT